MRWHTKRVVRLSILFSFYGLCALPSNSSVVQAPPAGIQKINHVVWIIQENRSFDNYFGKYPGADGIPPATCLPTLPGSTDCVKPFHMPVGQPAYDLVHDWETIHAAYNHGTMDGFVWVGGTNLTMGYYDEGDIPNYWNYARHFRLCDRFFSSQVNAICPGCIDTPATDQFFRENPEGLAEWIATRQSFGYAQMQLPL